MRPALLLLALLLVACPSPESDSTTLYVDSDAAAGGDGSEARPFTTIGEAVTAAGAMEEPLVLVAPGTYPESLSYAVRALTVAGHEGVPVVGDGVTPAFTVEAGANVELRDMTVTGVTATGSTLTLTDVGFSSLPLVADGSDLELERVDSTGLKPTLTGGSLLARGWTLGGLEGDAASLTDVEAIVLDMSVTAVTTPAETGLGIGINQVRGRLYLEDGTFTDISERGLRVEAGIADVHDSIFTGIGLTSIAYSPDAEGIGSAGVVSGCEFTDNSTDVSIGASDVIVRENHFVGSTTFAVSASSGASAQVDRNHFEDIVGSAVTMIGPFASNVTDNLIEGAGDGGISVQWSEGQVIVAWNEIHGAHFNGISFSGVYDSLVAYNTITETQLDLWFGTNAESISLIDASGAVHGNVITDGAGIGIDAHRLDGSITENTITNNAGGGIRVDGAGVQPLWISGNVASQNVGFGVIAMEADVLIEDNEFLHSDYNLDGFGDGVALITDTTAEVTGNSCRGNAASGIMAIDAVTATLEDNSLEDNDVYGIWVHCENEAMGIRASFVDIQHNEFDGNAYGEIHGCY